MDNKKTKIKRILKKIGIAIGVLFIAFIILCIVVGVNADKIDKWASENTTESTTSITTTEKETTTEPTTAITTTATTTEKATTTKPTTEDKTSGNADKVLYGDLISTTINSYDNIAVVKVKIDTGMGGKTAVDKNYYNVADLIRNKGYDKYNEVQYWAVSDTVDGGETKVISFTVSKDLITKIKDEKVVDNQLGNYVDDLWIHSGLK